MDLVFLIEWSIPVQTAMDGENTQDLLAHFSHIRFGQQHKTYDTSTQVRP